MRQRQSDLATRNLMSTPLVDSYEFEVFGNVQHVAFRVFMHRAILAINESSDCEISGKAENTKHKTVKGILYGGAKELQEMKEWLQYVGSPRSSIDECIFTNLQTGVPREIKGFHTNRIFPLWLSPDLLCSCFSYCRNRNKRTWAVVVQAACSCTSIKSLIYGEVKENCRTENCRTEVDRWRMSCISLRAFCGWSVLKVLRSVYRGMLLLLYFEHGIAYHRLIANHQSHFS